MQQVKTYNPFKPTPIQHHIQIDKHGDFTFSLVAGASTMKMNPLIRIGIHEPAEMNGASSLTWLGGLLLLLFLHRPGLLAPRRRRPGICCTGPPPDLPPRAAPPPICTVPGRIHLHLPFPRRPPPSLPCSSPARPELQHERGQQPPGVERDGERHERRRKRRWRTWECGGRPEDP